MSYRIGIDIGGTFTDFALQKGNDLLLHKNLSTPQDRSIGVIEGLERLASMEGLSLAQLLAATEALIHGTTVADNTLIEMNGACTGLLTTEGFRDELELRRGYKEDIWDIRLGPPTPIVPRRRRLGVPERLRFDGSVHTPLDEEAAKAAIARLAKQGVESVAVCTLFSFVNPAHELRLAQLVRDALPDVHLSLSHEVLPRSPEFERVSTTAVNAYVGPRVSSYIARLSERLQQAGYRRGLLLMQSNGGVMTRQYLERSPVRVLASGPAGGVIGGAATGAAKGASDLLCVDMGGTSYDVSVIRGGEAPAEAGWNWHHRYLVAVPMVQVETLGAGGGSICSADSGTLQVGPASAGADPGPVCYGRGGEQPTVTDAILTLGLLSDEEGFAGGSFRLTREGVHEALERHVAGPLGCSVEEAAFDCWRVVNANMTQAVRRLTAEKGCDPRDLTMLAYGGNGPAFAAIQAQELGIARVLVPRTSPGFSATGALTAQPCVDEERSYLAPAAGADTERLRTLWRELDEHAGRHLASAGFDAQQVARRYQVNMRYPGQNWSLTVDAAAVTGAGGLGFVDDDLPARMVERFHALHMAEYGHARDGEAPEITGVRLRASAEVPAPPFRGGTEATRQAAQPYKQRRANLGQGYGATDIYRGSDLQSGHEIHGPAIIEESFTTIVVYPGWNALVDDAGDYELLRAGNDTPRRTTGSKQ
ncbi:MAG: hydantoinase/oxoprolinase family protein [Halioglobus sp.]|nr:hydantoinase/oxoprolinase family protein [Halioglobus sp.]